MIENGNRKRRGKWSKPHPKKVIISKQILKELYDSGKTMDEIATILETTKRVIHLRMQEYKIERRNMIGPNHGSWKGGRVNTMGYWAIWKPEHHRHNHIGYVKEHILVMEKELGRKIEKQEHIHHIDFDRGNNDVDNLWVCTNKNHHVAEKSVFKVIKPLLMEGIVKFDKEKGEYKLVDLESLMSFMKSQIN